jgi:hypothetical protein
VAAGTGAPWRDVPEIMEIGIRYTGVTGSGNASHFGLRLDGAGSKKQGGLVLSSLRLCQVFRRKPLQ